MFAATHHASRCVVVSNKPAAAGVVVNKHQQQPIVRRAQMNSVSATMTATSRCVVGAAPRGSAMMTNAAGSGDLHLVLSHPTTTAPITAAAHTVNNVDVRALLPPPGPSSAQLIAVVAAKAPPAPPPAPEASPFVLFCRANWGYFAALQTVALIGAANNGRLARIRRLEIAEINEKLRAMMAKYEASNCDDGDDDGPTSASLAAGKAALKSADWNAAAECFEEAKAIADRTGDAAARLSAAKGVAQALAKAGQLRAAIAELEAVASSAETQGDSSVYGMLGDFHTDLAELSTAGAYYDKCLAMD